jgi:hypothetical protein
MSDYLTRLIQRSVHFGVGVKPRLTSLFVPPSNIVEPISEPDSDLAQVDGRSDKTHGTDRPTPAMAAIISSETAHTLRPTNKMPSPLMENGNNVADVSYQPSDSMPKTTSVQPRVPFNIKPVTRTESSSTEKSLSVPSDLHDNVSFHTQSALSSVIDQRPDKIPSTLTDNTENGDNGTDVSYRPSASMPKTASVQPRAPFNIKPIIHTESSGTEKSLSVASDLHDNVPFHAQSALSSVIDQQSDKISSTLTDNTENGNNGTDVSYRTSASRPKTASVQPRVPFNIKPVTRTESSITKEPSSTIRIHIGRIEVRAMLPSALPVSKSAPASVRPPLSLDDYLKRRNEGGR